MTRVMGILNLTPDSFSDGGENADVADAVTRAVAMERDGAAMIDVGGQSTRPGFTPVSAEIEWARIAPTLAELPSALTTPISVDTFYPAVARRAAACGVTVFNDVSGATTGEMFAAARDCGATLIYTFAAPFSDNALAAAEKSYNAALAVARDCGLPADRLIFDIGIGFGKTREQDREMLRLLPTLTARYSQPFLVGVSRKRVTDPEGTLPPNKRLAATLALQTVAQLGGASWLRCHDVRPACEAIAAIERQKG